MLDSGIIVLFLIPGIAVYCALYGLFTGDGENIPEPPAASSVETVAIIIFACIAVHLTTAALISGTQLACDGACPDIDVYQHAFKDMTGSGKDKVAMIGSREVLAPLFVIAVQCAIGYWAVRTWMRRAGANGKLPIWIYGWAKAVLEGYDDTGNALVAYVLTDLEVSARSVVYVGVVDNVSLKADGSIQRINLRDAERYVADLSKSYLRGPLVRFPFMILSGDTIKNVAFKLIELPTPPAAAPRDPLALGLVRLYSAPSGA